RNEYGSHAFPRTTILTKNWIQNVGFLSVSGHPTDREGRRGNKEPRRERKVVSSTRRAKSLPPVRPLQDSKKGVGGAEVRVPRRKRKERGSCYRYHSPDAIPVACRIIPWVYLDVHIDLLPCSC